MAAPQQHIIGRQILEVDVPPGVDPYEVQERVSYAFRTQVMPRLASLFDRISDPDTVIQIDRLEIDIGSLPVEHLEKALEEEVMARIENALFDEVRGFTQSSVERPPSAKSHTLSLFEAWLHFLERGYVPWHTVIKDWRQWESVVVDQLNRSSSMLLYVLRRGPRAIERLVRQFSLQVIQKSLEAIKPGSVDEAIVFKEFLWHVWPTVSTRYMSSDALSTMYWSAVFHAVIHEGGERSFAHLLVNSVLQKVAMEMSTPVKALTLALHSLVDSKGAIEDQQPQSEHLNRGGVRSIKEALSQKVAQYGVIESGDFEEWEGDGLDTSLPELKDPNQEKSPEPGKEDNIRDDVFINNAGLVLLHPYLEMFFGHLGLVRDHEFVDEDVQRRCVLLLQYLASGNHEVRETDLVLNKVLCGLPVATPVDSSIRLTDDEIAESENLLKAIINHWTVLKNTSPDGLRYNFIMRDGKLSQSGMVWKLLVDHKAHDILLNNLPWGFSTIKLPWMKQLIQVEWNS